MNATTQPQQYQQQATASMIPQILFSTVPGLFGDLGDLVFLTVVFSLGYFSISHVLQRVGLSPPGPWIKTVSFEEDEETDKQGSWTAANLGSPKALLHRIISFTTLARWSSPVSGKPFDCETADSKTTAADPEVPNDDIATSAALHPATSSPIDSDPVVEPKCDDAEPDEVVAPAAEIDELLYAPADVESDVEIVAQPPKIDELIYVPEEDEAAVAEKKEEYLSEEDKLCKIGIRVDELVAEHDGRLNENGMPEEPDEAAEALEEMGFVSSEVPGLGIGEYMLSRLVRFARMDANRILVALALMRRLADSGRDEDKKADDGEKEGLRLLTSWSGHRLFLVASLVSSKMYQDATFDMSYWAGVGGVELSELQSLEVAFLKRLRWQTAVSVQEYQAMARLIGVTDSLEPQSWD